MGPGTIDVGALEQCRSRLRGVLALFFADDADARRSGLHEDGEPFESAARSNAIASFIDALEAAQASAICLNSAGKVVGDTAQARALYDNCFRVSGGQLSITDKRDGDRLRDALREVKQDAKRLSFVLRSTERPEGLLVSVVRLQSAASPPPVALLVLLRDLAGFRTPEATLLADAFALTPAEAETASLLAAGHSVEKISTLRGVSKDTVRTMLKAIFSKTHTERQSQLVLLLSRFAGI